MTAPLAPSAGSGRPFSSKETPPALPMVRTNGRFEIHSRTSPAGTFSSLVRPSSVRTRIHVVSLVRATSRYGDVASLKPSRFGGGTAAGVTGGTGAAAGGEAGGLGVTATTGGGVVEGGTGCGAVGTVRASRPS